MSVLAKSLELFAVLDTQSEVLFPGKLVWNCYLSCARLPISQWARPHLYFGCMPWSPPESSWVYPHSPILFDTNCSGLLGFGPWMLVDLVWGIYCADPAILTHRNLSNSAENTCVLAQGFWRESSFQQTRQTLPWLRTFLYFALLAATKNRVCGRELEKLMDP